MAVMRSPILLLVAGLLASGCEAATDLVIPPRFESAREAYAGGLRAAGLDATALGRDWIAAGDGALRSPVPVDLPHRETTYFPADSAIALGYRIEGLRGRRITATITIVGVDRARVFADVYQVARDPADAPRLVATLDSTETTFSWEPRRDGEFVFRLQPELLRSGSVTVELRSEPALAFPVEGRSWEAVQSVFGDPRDAGARRHHGVDIFAPRGTPTLAAAEGRVRGVRTTPRGGRVVWLRDEARGMSIYYAHLDSQAVVNGQWVQPGDTVGFVGNTGNARTTPPHLHFGIYRRGEGPTDPDPWLRIWEPEVREVTADTALLGRWVRSVPPQTRVDLLPLTGWVDRRQSDPDSPSGEPTGDALERIQVPSGTALRVVAAAGSSYRVRLPDGRVGYVRERDTERADDPLRTAELTGATLRASPAPGAPVVANPAGPIAAEVLGVFEQQALVRGPGRLVGWSALDALD